MATVRNSMLLSLVERFGNTAIQLGSSMILARLLTPEEFGIHSLSMAILAITHMFRDFGVGNYLVVEKEITELRIRTAFAVLLGIASIAALILTLLNSTLVGAYNEPRLEPVLWLLSLNFLIIPFGAPALAMMRRELDYRRILYVNLIGAAIGAVVSVCLAKTGFGVISLAWGAVAGTLATSILALIARPELAGIRPSLKEWRRVMSFGGMSAAISVLGSIGERAPDLVVGPILGFGAVGYLSRGNSLLALYRNSIVNALSPVLLPAFSQIHHRGGSIKPAYLKAVSYMATVSWTFFTFVFFYADHMILFLFGDQWGPAVPLAQALCFLGFSNAFNHLNGPVLMSIGKIRSALMIESFIQPTKVLLILVAATHSLQAVPVAYVAISFINMAITTTYIARNLEVSLGDLLSTLWRSVVLAVGTTIAPWCILTYSGIENVFIMLSFGSCTAVISWLTLGFALRQPLVLEVLAAVATQSGKLQRRLLTDRSNP